MAAREGTLKLKPLPDKIDLAKAMASVWILFWTEDKGRSVTSRHVEDKWRSVRVRVLEDEADFLVVRVRVLRMERISESGLSLDLNGRESESESVWRRLRLPLPDIVDGWREMFLGIRVE